MPSNPFLQIGEGASAAGGRRHRKQQRLSCAIGSRARGWAVRRAASINLPADLVKPALIRQTSAIKTIGQNPAGPGDQRRTSATTQILSIAARSGDPIGNS